MLRYMKNKWGFSPAKVTYEQNNKKGENYIGAEGKDWWEELATRRIIKNIKFQEMEYSSEQKYRLEEINKLGVGDGYSEDLSNYVITGVFPEEPNHILSGLEVKKLKQENKILKLQNNSNTDAIEFNEAVLQDLIISTYEGV